MEKVMARPQRMHRHLLSYLWCAMLLFAVPLPAIAQTPIPALDSPVVDPTGVLSASTTDRLQQQSRALFERSGGAQLQVLVVGSTGDESIEAYAQRVYDQWQLGRKGVDDGVLLLVAVQDRHVRIQPGYGLEGAIPDAYAKRIIEETILPRFRDGDIDQGVIDGSAQVVRLIDGEPLPAPRSNHLLDLTWQAMDSILLLAMACAFGLGRWHGRRAAVPARRWWSRPWNWLAIIVLAALGMAAWQPRLVVPVVFLLVLLVPLAWSCGRRWNQSAGTRRLLWAMLVASTAINVFVLVTRGTVPGLFVHVALYFLTGIACGVVGLPLALARNCWQTSQRGFVVRALAFCGVFGAGLGWALTRADPFDPAALLIVFGAGGYVAWNVAMLVGLGSTGSGDDDDRRSGRSGSSSSSSDSSWSGGGGSSGGGGASGSW